MQFPESAIRTDLKAINFTIVVVMLVSDTNSSIFI